MALFKKKKSKDEEDILEDDDGFEEDEKESKRSLKRKLPKSKDFKDLNPENKRKRTEPKKPWGIKERFMVLLVLLLTAGFSGFMALSARDYKLPGLPRLKVGELKLPRIFGEETIILEGDAENNVDEAIEAFKERTDNLSGVYGFYVYDLEEKHGYGVNQKEIFQAASLIKLPVMIGMYLESEKDRLDLDSTYVLKESDKKGGSGSLQSKPAGYEITFRELIKLMGKESDNTAFNICRKHLGDEKIKSVIKDLGMTGTDFIENETTPEDIGKVFTELYQGQLLNPENSDELLDFMTNTIYENWLSAGIPRGIKVSHKYGRELHVVNDAGIILDDNPMVMVLMSKGVVEREADTELPNLARLLYESSIK